MFVNYRQKRSGISTVYWHHKTNFLFNIGSLQKPIVHSLGVLHYISYAPISIRRFQQYVLVLLLQLGYVENTPNKYRGKSSSSQLLCVLLVALKIYNYKRYVNAIIEMEGGWGGWKLHKCQIESAISLARDGFVLHFSC